MSFLEILHELSRGNLTEDEKWEIIDSVAMENLTELIEADKGNCSAFSQPIPHLAITEVTISVLGVILNGIAIFVITALRDFKKNISHWYVLQLAIADSIFLVLLLMMAHQHLVGTWELPEWMCSSFQAFLMTNYYAGIFFLTVMSFDRYVAIVHPVSAYWRRMRTHGNAVVVTIIVWVASILLSAPAWKWSKVSCTCGNSFPDDSTSNTSIEEEYMEMMEFGEPLEDYEMLEGGSFMCFNHVPGPYRIWLILNFLLTFLLPLVILMICYSFILWRVLHPAISSANKSNGRRKSHDNQPRGKKHSVLSSFRSSLSSTSSKSPSGRRVLSQKNKVTVIVVSLLVVFIFCWFPFHVLQLLKVTGFRFTESGCEQLADAVNLIAYLNSMLNPIFYTFLGSRFYQRLRTAISSFQRKTRSSGTVRYTRSSRTGVPAGSRNSATTAFNKATDASSSCHMHTTHTIVSKYPSHSQQDKSQLLNVATKDSDVCTET